MAILPATIPTYAATTTSADRLVSNKGVVYLVSSKGTLRPYTSAGAFTSYEYNNFANVVPANSDDLKLPMAGFIPPNEGKVFCSDRKPDKGTCYIITAGKKAGFTSEKVFTDLGYSFTGAIYGDVSWVESDTPITSSTEAHRPGSIIKDGETYKVIFDDKSTLTFPDYETVKTWGNTTGIVQANAADKKLINIGTAPSKLPGQIGIWNQYIQFPASSTMIQ